jgi:hypothetical protein
MYETYGQYPQLPNSETELSDKANAAVITLLSHVDPGKVEYYAPDGEVKISELINCIHFLEKQAIHIRNKVLWIKNFVILYNELLTMNSDSFDEIKTNLVNYIRGLQVSDKFYEAKDELKEQGYADRQIFV